VPGDLKHCELSSGVSLAYRDEGAGEPLILIHGITEDHRAWDVFIPELTRRARVIRLDLPGHGASSSLPAYSAATLVEPVAQLVQSLALERPRVVGHSLGGLIATLLGAFVPVRSLVNVDQPLRLGTFIERVRRIAPALEGPQFTVALNAEMEELGGPRLPVGVRDGLRSYRVEARRPVVLGLWLPLVDATEDSVTAQLAPLLAQVRAPYLSLHGEDPGADYELWLRKVIPTAKTEVWPGLGHWLHRVEPERFLALLDRWDAVT
jgi:pimeloyl-ACP methyl ester carboxylesterase